MSDEPDGGPSRGPGQEAGRRVPTVVAKVVVPVLVAILVTAFTPVGDWLKELLFPTSAVVRGTVRMLGGPVEGAEVSLDEKQRTRSGSDGNFRFTRVADGTHRLLINVAGAGVYDETVVVKSGDDEKNLKTIEVRSVLAGDISMDLRAGAPMVNYDVAVWLSGDEGILSQTRRVTYRFSQLSVKPVVTELKRTQFCGRLTGSLRLPEVPRGSVEASVESNEGSTVRLLVPELQVIGPGARPPSCGSSPRSRVRVSDVTGEDAVSAAAELDEAGFDVEHRPESRNTVEAGTVIRTDSLAGAEVEEGSKVRSVVSSGPPTTKDRVRVPDVTGQDSMFAAGLLSAAGFTVGEVREPSSSVKTDRVIRTEPRAGSEVEGGSTVTMVVSTTPRVRVPDVIGEDHVTAAAELGAAGFDVVEQSESSNTVAEGMVIRTDPPAGAEVEKGSKVRMAVSSGKEQPAVPDVVGLSQSAATATLRSAGFNVAVQEVTGDAARNGKVIAQNPTGGKKAPAGSTVTITVVRAVSTSNE